MTSWGLLLGSKLLHLVGYFCDQGHLRILDQQLGDGIVCGVIINGGGTCHSSSKNAGRVPSPEFHMDWIPYNGIDMLGGVLNFQTCLLNKVCFNSIVIQWGLQMPLILDNNSISKCWQSSNAGIPYGLKVEICCCAEK